MIRPLRQVVEALGSPYAREDLVADCDVPLLAVDVSGGHVEGDLLAELRSLPLVTVAISEAPILSQGVAAFDSLLCDAGDTSGPTGPRWTTPARGAPAALDRIHARVAANPQAAVALVQLLRLSANLDVIDGLVAESFTYSTLQGGPEFARWLGGQSEPEPVALDPVALVVERDGTELRLTFNRPEIHNAFGFEVRDELVDALRLAAIDDTIGSITIAGRGRSFCAGGDLREFGTRTDPASAHLIRTTRSAGYWIHRVAERVRVELHGACVGSGIELPSFAGHVVAAANTFIELPELSLGLVPGAGGTVSIPRRIGRHRCAYLALSGERLDALTALEWGLVDELAGS